MRPVARRSGLLIRDLPGEVLVYDTESHRAHCLNRLAGEVFRHADGTRTVADLAALVGEHGGGEQVVLGALANLVDAGLIEETDAKTTGGLTRREVVRRVGIGAAVLLPAVVSVLAPTPAEAAVTCVCDCTGKSSNTPCTTSFQPVCSDTCDGLGNCNDGGPNC
jgi:hypothetical protein